MTVKITIKPQYKEVEFGDYGLFKVRPLGAGEELQISIFSRELSDLLDEASELDKNKETMSKKDVESALSRVSEIMKEVESIKTKMAEIIFSQISGANEKAQLERLTMEIPLGQLRQIIGEALNA